MSVLLILSSSDSHAEAVMEDFAALLRAKKENLILLYYIYALLLENLEPFTEAGGGLIVEPAWKSTIVFFQTFRLHMINIKLIYMVLF